MVALFYQGRGMRRLPIKHIFQYSHRPLDSFNVLSLGFMGVMVVPDKNLLFGY